MMSRFGVVAVVASGALLLGVSALGQGEFQGQGQVISTVLPRHEGDPIPVFSGAGAKLKVNGKDVAVTKIVPLTGAQDQLELVVLIDGSARSSLGQQFEEITHFVQSLPPNVRVGIGYMQNGQTVMAGALSSDHAEVLRGLHLPGGSAGSNGSPYFCLSDLAKRWPSNEPDARREVLMVTDGVDPYNRRFDPQDQYMLSAIADSVRARLVVYSIFWRGQGFGDSSLFASSAGQSLLHMVAEATGGKSFWQGSGNPVSFAPYLDELSRRLRNQYEVSFLMPFNGKPQVYGMKLKFSVPGSTVDSPQQVFVVRPGSLQD